MSISVPKKLKILSYFLPGIYIVGGYVRNSILGYEASDIDISGEYTVDEVELALSHTEFLMASVNKRLGTVKIYSKEDKTFSCEYTTFRIDSYPCGSGAHSPTDVVFTKEIGKDSFRRDFTINAIYYGIDTAELVDLTGGLTDLNQKILRTTRAPEKVFSEDGLRILRLVRFASELGFDIEEHTFDVAKKMSYLIKDISGERIREELVKIIVADTRYKASSKDAHLRGIRMLDELGVLQYIMPDLLLGKGIDQNSNYHVYDIYEHSLQCMYYCPPKIRLAGLLHDVGKPESLKKHGNMYFHGEIGREIARRIMGRDGLKFSNKEINNTCRLIGAHMYDIDGLTSEKKLRMFIIDNIDLIDEIVAIKQADAKASAGSEDAVSVSAERLQKILKIMRDDGTPFGIADLQIDGNDLIGTKIPEDKRAWAMRKVLEHVVSHPDCRTRETQLIYLKGLNYGNN